MQTLNKISFRHTHSRLISILAMIGSAAYWGGATVMSRDLLDHFAAPTLLVVQLVASVCVLLLLSLPHKPWRYMACQWQKPR